MIYALFNKGKTPFKRQNEYLTFESILKGEYQMSESIPPLAQDLIRKLLVVDPQKRLGGYVNIE